MHEDLRLRVEDALRRLGVTLDRPIGLDEEGVVGFQLADGASCSIEVPAGADRVFLHSSVGRMPPDDRERCLTSAMRRNLFDLSPAGAWLAYDAPADELLLCRTVSAAEFAPDDLPEMVLSMTDGALRLREDLFGRSDSGAKPSSSADPLIRV